MEMHQIRYFLSVARQLNFTKAAEECNVAQPSLTRAIQKLEEELGGLLLHRERQNTHLTELGRAMLPFLEKTFSAAQAAKQLARGINKGEMSHLRIGILDSVSADLLVDILRRLNASLNRFELTLTRLPAKELVASALEGELDLILLTSTVSLPERMRDWILFSEPFKLVMVPDHPLSGKDSIAPADLVDIDLIELIDCPEFGRFKDACGLSDITLKTPYRVHGGDELLRLARAEFGVGLVPATTPMIDGLVARPLAHEETRRQITIALVAGRPFMIATETCLRLARGQDWSRQLSPRAN